MKTKNQTFEVVLITTDEEVDGENLIESAIQDYINKNKKEHIESVLVDTMKNEWTE